MTPTRLNYHQCAAPTWVMQWQPECNRKLTKLTRGWLGGRLKELAGKEFREELTTLCDDCHVILMILMTIVSQDHTLTSSPIAQVSPSLHEGIGVFISLDGR